MICAAGGGHLNPACASVGDVTANSWEVGGYGNSLAGSSGTKDGAATGAGDGGRGRDVGEAAGFGGSAAPSAYGYG